MSPVNVSVDMILEFTYNYNCMASYLLLAAVDCGSLPNPPNGLVVAPVTTFGNSASYSCNLGFILVGDETRLCRSDGRWSGSEPTCIGKCLVMCISEGMIDMV